MNSEAIVTIGAAVVALTQMAKWAGINDKHGPVAVAVLSMLGVMMWGVSNQAAFDRAMIWPFFSAWIAVATSAAGVFGYTRATREAIVRTSTPPNDGAGSSRTDRDDGKA